MKLSGLVLGSAIAVSLVGAGFSSTSVSAQEDCVVISGGDVLNETVIDINANAGTSISDASAGSNNAATTSGGGGEGEVLNVASAGNGGVAPSAANGGAISVGNVNSGGNVGNAITVGDTWCAEAVGDYAVEEPVYEAAADEAAAEEVVALPATGVGAGEFGSIFAILASAGAAAASFGLRRR